MVCKDFKKERRIIPMKSISKKSRKVIEEHLEELRMRHPLIEITRIGARMAL